MQRRCLFALLATPCCLLSACQPNPQAQSAGSDAPHQVAEPAAPAATAFEIDSDFGEEAAWMPDYLAKCAAALVRLMDAPDVIPPQTIQVELRRVDGHPGIGGWAAAPRVEVEGRSEHLLLMGFESAVWPEDEHRHWIVAHELVNLLAHHYGGAGGYPSDFWSNGRSPFPEYLSCVVMREAGYPDHADWRRSVSADEPDHVLYWTLHEQYGFGVFARFFRLLRADGVRIGDLGDPAAVWPAPDATRSLYTIGYLSLAAGRNLAPIFRDAGVGREPDNWSEIHPEIEFREYLISDRDVAILMAERQRLFGEAGLKRADLEPARERFREGHL